MFLVAWVFVASLSIALCFQTTPPTRFKVDKRNYNDILPASLPLIFRRGAGAVVSGYELSIVKETDSNKQDYAVFSFLGFRILETTNKPFINRPQKLLELYEFEGCPFCRKVREAISVLDLDVTIYPCPKGTFSILCINFRYYFE